MLWVILSFLFILSITSSSPVPESPFLPGPCPKVSPMPDLDLSLYQGKWRQVALFPNVTAPLVGHGYHQDLLCVTSSYKLEEAGYLVTNTGLDTETGEEVIITATLEHNQNDLSLHLDPSFDLPDEVYQVLETDYVTYASVWNCKEFPMLGILVRIEFAWIIGREEVMGAMGKMPERALKNAIGAYERFGIDVKQFEISDQLRC